MLEVAGKLIDTDQHGYLKHQDEWSEAVAEAIAAQEMIPMTPAHWEVIWFVREFYHEYRTSPAIRALVKAMEQKYGAEKGSSRYLYKLFPKGPAKQATKIAGLPKPVKCI
ncbi:MAG: TusE/DsrC/DsvC family sulfur relay protein [Aeromonadaceae bacterium]